MRVSSSSVTSSASSAAAPSAECGLRLTLTSATPITTTNVTAASTLYFTPYTSGRIAIYDGSSWVARTTAEVSLALSGLTSGKNYDVFAGWTGSAITLSLVVWTNDSTRATALATQDGVFVKSGDATKKYVGTIRTTGATTTEDSLLKRYVFNWYNQKKRHLLVTETTSSWTYATATWRQANGSASNAFELVCGQPTELSAETHVLSQCALSGTAATGIGIDSTSSPSQSVYGGTSATVGTNDHQAKYHGYLDSGYHAINWLEYANGTNTATFYSNNTTAGFGISGMTGTIDA